jgi:hypothetical protein
MDHLGKYLNGSASATVGPKPNGTWTSEPNARKAAQTIMQRYPDYRSAPPEYLVSLTDLLKTYPEWALILLCDIRTGITTKTKFLPTPKDVTDFIEPLLEQERKMARFQAIKQRAPVPAISGTVGKPRPFPKLWEAFADDCEMFAKLERCLPFDTLSRASLLLATRGTTAARDFLAGVV